MNGICRDCTWWQRDDSGLWGTCQLTLHRVDGDARLSILGTLAVVQLERLPDDRRPKFRASGRLETQPEFGCVQFTASTVQPEMGSKRTLTATEGEAAP